MTRNFDIHDVGFTARFKKQQGHVFQEDVAVLEAQQRSILANPQLKLRAFSIDAGGVKARHVIERMIGDQPSALADRPALPDTLS
jgi:vanillate O-demethylase monooxygenase subunit